jgi:hypothetical protein
MDEIDKLCKGCGVLKPLSEFKTTGRKRKDGTRGRTNYCYSCIYKRRWSTPEKKEMRTKYELERRRKKRAERQPKSHYCSSTLDWDLMLTCSERDGDLVVGIDGIRGGNLTIEMNGFAIDVSFCPICGKPSKFRKYMDEIRRMLRENHANRTNQKAGKDYTL